MCPRGPAPRPQEAVSGRFFVEARLASGLLQWAHMSRIPNQVLSFGASLALVLGVSAPAAAEPAEPTPEDMAEYYRASTETKHFLVVGTYGTYAVASRAMSALAKKVGMGAPSQPVELVDGEMSYTRSACEENGWDYPCYVARGRYDDGAYLSVEPSSAYGGMEPGYFVIVAASGNAELVREQERTMRKHGVSSFRQSEAIWLGCMH